jgi:hypothetical protein
MGDNAATDTAAYTLITLKRSFNAMWPKLPEDWDVIKEASPGTPEDERVEALFSDCVLAREHLQTELMRPEVVLVTARLRLQSEYMAIMWLVIKANVPVSLFKIHASKARAAIIKSTSVAIPDAFNKFFDAVNTGVKTPPPMTPF